MWFFAFVCLFFFIVLLFYIDNDRLRRRFESKGIAYTGNGFVNLLLGTVKGENMVDNVVMQYNVAKASNLKMAIGKDFGETTLIVADPDLLRSILVKDFDHFTDHRHFPNGTSDFAFSRMLFFMKGDRWKLVRTKLTPAFTTGKIKRMFRSFEQSGKKLMKFLESEVQGMENGEADLPEAYSKFSMDIIASVACGMDSQAFNQKAPSVFEKKAKGARIEFGAKTILKMFVMSVMPTKVSKAMGLGFFESGVYSFFDSAIRYSMKERLEKGQKWDDFIQLMLEARAGTLKTDENELEAFEKDAMIQDNKTPKLTTSDVLDDDGIVANCIGLMSAGFDITQSLFLFSAYSVAVNPHIQDKLRAEVRSALDKNDGQFTYEGLNSIAYLDMVMHETLRLYPPASATDRQCIIDYPIPGTNYVLKKGEAVTIPIYGLHHDPEYYPEPEQFIPERFSPEKKSKINQYVYLPFGQGPRNCLGMRFVLMEAKVMLANLVNSFIIEPSAKTPIPIKFGRSGTLKPEGSLHLKLTKIQD